jgi:hypothetical protein
LLENGRKVRFWWDVWIGDCPLKNQFPNIFQICRQQDWSVFEVLGLGDQNLTFRRNFGDKEIEEREELTKMVDGVTLSQEKDRVAWVYEKIELFSTASIYKELMFSCYGCCKKGTGRVKLLVKCVAGRR